MAPVLSAFEWAMEKHVQHRVERVFLAERPGKLRVESVGDGIRRTLWYSN